MVDAKFLDQGRRRLKNLLPWARAKAREDGDATAFECLSPIFQATASYVVEENFDALVVYPERTGGWHADLVLKRVPPGVPDVVGTPVKQPCASREEALGFAKNLLVNACRWAAMKKTAAPPVFLLHGRVFPLIPEVFERVEREAGALEGYGSAFQAAVRVELVIDELSAAGYELVKFNDWPVGQKATLLAVLHKATLSGLFRFPVTQDATDAVALFER